MPPSGWRESRKHTTGCRAPWAVGPLSRGSGCPCEPPCDSTEHLTCGAAAAAWAWHAGETQALSPVGWELLPRHGEQLNKRAALGSPPGRRPDLLTEGHGSSPSSSQRPQALRKIRQSPAAPGAPLPGARVPGWVGCLVILPGCRCSQSPVWPVQGTNARTVEREPLGGQGPRRHTSRVQLCYFPQTTPPWAGGSPLSLRTAPESTAPLTP